jgi:hypothetical protein
MTRGCQTLSVMAGPVLAIHAFNLRKDVDARHKAGHDDRVSFYRCCGPDGSGRSGGSGRSPSEGSRLVPPEEVPLSANLKRDGLGNLLPAAGIPALP